MFRTRRTPKPLLTDQPSTRPSQPPIPVPPNVEDLAALQRTRVAALRAAREALTARSPLGGPSAPDALDLVNVAQWIVDGNDPWVGVKAALGAPADGS